MKETYLAASPGNSWCPGQTLREDPVRQLLHREWRRGWWRHRSDFRTWRLQIKGAERLMLGKRGKRGGGRGSWGRFQSFCEGNRRRGGGEFPPLSPTTHAGCGGVFLRSVHFSLVLLREGARQAREKRIWILNWEKRRKTKRKKTVLNPFHSLLPSLVTLK
jgi:hypothetical protein